MTTQTVQSAGVAATPRVNLMPPEIAEAARLRRIQLGMGCAVLASVVVVGGLYLHERSGVSNAKNELQAAQAQQTSLNEKLASLNSVAQTFAAVHAKQNLLDEAMGQEIRWSYVLNDLSFRIPSDVWLTSISATENTAGATSTTTTAPTTTSSTPTTLGGATTANGPIGSVSFAVTGFQHDDIATWLDALAKVRGFDGPTFSSSTETAIGTRTVVNAATAVNLTSAALSHRYSTGSGN